MEQNPVLVPNPVSSNTLTELESLLGYQSIRKHGLRACDQARRATSHADGGPVRYGQNSWRVGESLAVRSMGPTLHFAFLAGTPASSVDAMLSGLTLVSKSTWTLPFVEN